jgi:excisionase family DNA binding protein
MTHTQGLLTVKELSSYLEVSTCTVYRLVECDAIPFIRRQGLGIRFRKEDIDEWLEKSTSKPVPDLDTLGLVLTLPPKRPINGSHGKKGGIGEMAKAKSKTRHNFGFGAIYQRKTKKGNIRWYLDYREAGGKRVQRLAVHASSKEEAFLALKNAVLNEHYRECGVQCLPQRLKFSELSRMYLDDYAKQNKRSWRDDQYRLEANMNPYFGNYGLQEITPHMVEQYRARRLKSGVTPSTVNREITILKKMFNLAMDWGLAQSNPVLKVKLFSEKNTQKERILTETEESRLLVECPPFLKPIVVTALNTGMRRGEILGLRWTQVDLEKRSIRVVQTKSGKDRAIPLNEPLHGVFSALRALDTRTELVFPNPMTGKSYTEVKKSFKAACKRAGISNLRFHDLRHTFASRLVTMGVDIVTVRDLLGHFSVNVTQRYTHPGQSQKIAAVELLARKMGQNRENLLHPCYTN